MTKGSAIPRASDRLLAVAFVVFVTVALAVAVSLDTGASFTAATTNPSNHANTLSVQPPASQNAATSAAGGVVNLSWTATPTAPGVGHTLAYLVLRGPVGGPYAQVGSTASLGYSDTPPGDGRYGYVIEAKVTGSTSGAFTSPATAPQSGLSDRTGPALSIACNGATCTSSWYVAPVTVTVTGTDAGAGMGSVTEDVDAGGQVSTAGSSAAFTVSGDSTGHTVQYFAADALGNVSATSSQTIKIDATPPAAPGAFAAAAGAWGGTATLTFSWTAATDALSGVSGQTLHWFKSSAACPAADPTVYANAVALGPAATSYVLSGKKFGYYCGYVDATDNAGNRSAPSAVAGSFAV